MDYTRLTIFICGLLFVVLSGFMVFVGFIANTSPPSITLMLVAMAVMSFCISYLYPQFKQKDERMELIRHKGMLASFVAMIVYLMIFNLGFQLEWIALSAMQVVNILTTLLICTVFVSFVVYSKLY